MDVARLNVLWTLDLRCAYDYRFADMKISPRRQFFADDTLRRSGQIRVPHGRNLDALERTLIRKPLPFHVKPGIGFRDPGQRTSLRLAVAEAFQPMCRLAGFASQE